MTNAQLYLAIGIPALTQIIVLTLAVIVNNRQIDAMRMEMNARFDSLGREMSARFDVISAEIRRVEQVLGAKIDALTERVGKLEEDTRKVIR